MGEVDDLLSDVSRTLNLNVSSGGCCVEGAYVLCEGW